MNGLLRRKHHLFTPLDRALDFLSIILLRCTYGLSTDRSMLKEPPSESWPPIESWDRGAQDTVESCQGPPEKKFVGLRMSLRYRVLAYYAQSSVLSTER